MGVEVVAVTDHSRSTNRRLGANSGKVLASPRLPKLAVSLILEMLDAPGLGDTAEKAERANEGRWGRLENTFLLTPKILYFLSMSVVATLYVFRYAFLGEKYLKLDGRAFGIISAAMAVTGAIGAALWSWLADRMQAHRVVFVVLLLGAAISLEPFHLWIKNIESYELRYRVTLLAMSGHNLLMGGVIPLADYFTMQILRRHNAINSYGRQCLFGTFAYTIVTFAVGDLTQRGLISWIFTVQRSTVLLTILCITVIPMPTVKEANPTPFTRPSPENNVKSKNATGTISKWKKLLSNPHFLFMLLVVSVIGFCRGVMSIFLSNYCFKMLNLSDRQNTAVSFSGTIFEVIIFLTASFCQRILGAHNMFILAQMAMALRAWFYVLVPLENKLVAVCGIELLKGLGYGMTQLAGTKVALERAPPGLEATALALYSAVYSQIPLFLAAILGAYLGMNHLFKTTAILITAGMVVCIVKNIIVRSPPNTSAPM